MPKGRSGLPHSKTLREISEHYKQTPAFGVRWEAERHTAFLRRKSEREEKAPSSLRFAGAVQNTTSASRNVRA